MAAPVLPSPNSSNTSAPRRGRRPLHERRPPDRHGSISPILVWPGPTLAITTLSADLRMAVGAADDRPFAPGTGLADTSRHQVVPPFHSIHPLSPVLPSILVDPFQDLTICPYHSIPFSSFIHSIRSMTIRPRVTLSLGVDPGNRSVRVRLLIHHFHLAWHISISLCQPAICQIGVAGDRIVGGGVVGITRRCLLGPRYSLPRIGELTAASVRMPAGVRTAWHRQSRGHGLRETAVVTVRRWHPRGGR